MRQPYRLLKKMTSVSKLVALLQSKFSWLLETYLRLSADALGPNLVRPTQSKKQPTDLAPSQTSTLVVNYSAPWITSPQEAALRSASMVVPPRKRTATTTSPAKVRSRQDVFSPLKEKTLSKRLKKRSRKSSTTSSQTASTSPVRTSQKLKLKTSYGQRLKSSCPTSPVPK